jgi:hypothetical protein
VTDPGPRNWPPDVTPISVEELDRLGVNARNQLYWDGKRIEVRNHIDLTRLQKVLAVIVSICAVLGAIGGFMTGFNNASVFLCARGIQWLTCPTEAPGRQQ